MKHALGIVPLVCGTLLFSGQAYTQESKVEKLSEPEATTLAAAETTDEENNEFPKTPENSVKRCKDGIDNDEDEHLDCDDQDCQVFIICLDKVQAQTAAQTAAVGAAPAESEEQEISLDDLDEETSSSAAPSPIAAPAETGGHGHAAGAFPPKFKLFFDLLTEYEWETKTFQFTRDHAHVMIDLTVTDWLAFRADIAFEPEFFEVIFNIKGKMEFRLGKILVPFGQNEFHHLIGGRVDEDALFLPTIWGDYGLAFKHSAYDGDFVSFDYSLYAINGFQDTVDEYGDPMPSTRDGSLTDNNQMKGVGLRAALHLGTAVTLGTSWYVDAWDENNDQFMLYYGADLELGYDLMPVPVLKNIRLRAEAAWGEIMLPNQDNYHGIFGGEANGILKNFGMRKSGYNLELSYRIVKWLFLRYREGYLNDDNRVTNAHDLLIHEPGVVAVFGPVQLSLMVQLHQFIAENPDPPPTEFSRLYFRLLFRY